MLLKHFSKREKQTSFVAIGALRVKVHEVNWLCSLVAMFLYQSNYTQKKKFSQYLCFLIKSTILDISLSNCIHELYYLTLHVSVYCVINNASIRLYQPIFKIHDVHVLQ